MRIATVLTPPDDRSLRWAAQCGVTDLTLRYPGPNTQELLDEIERVSAYGFKVSAIEGHLPIEQLKLGQPGRKAELGELRRLFEVMKQAQIPILCYDFMAGTDWVRTQVDAPERAALRPRFDIDQPGRGQSAERPPAGVLRNRRGAVVGKPALPAQNACPTRPRPASTCMHPDDPPLPSFMGGADHGVAGREAAIPFRRSSQRSLQLPGTLPRWESTPSAIRRLGSHIRFVHFRDVRGT